MIDSDGLQFSGSAGPGFAIGKHAVVLSSISTFSYNPESETGLALVITNAPGNRFVMHTAGAVFTASLRYSTWDSSLGQLPSSLEFAAMNSFAVVEFINLLDLDSQPLSLEPDFGQSGPGTGIYRDPTTSNWMIYLSINSKPFPAAASFSGIRIRFIHAPIRENGRTSQDLTKLRRRSTTAAIFSLARDSAVSLNYIYANE